MRNKDIDERVLINYGSTHDERLVRKDFFDLFCKCPIPEEERLDNLGLFIRRQAFSRMMFMHEIYQKILPVIGVVVEFGVRWGQNMALFSTFRGMYEPYNYQRKIIGFDTFAGFPSVSSYDNLDNPANRIGGYNVTHQYDDYLHQILNYHEQESPISHIPKFELIKGDVTVTLEEYLQRNPETIIALAYFDVDLYEPTKRCLELIKNHIVKGSVLGFDELAYRGQPGETRALKEVFELKNCLIRRPLHIPLVSYMVCE